MNTNEKIKSFTDLKAWQKSHLFVLSIYTITKSFPKEERYGIVDQMRRAAISISSNIAEGFSRHSGLEKKQFYYLALGSLTELQNQLLVSKDVSYISPEVFQRLAKDSVEVSRLINSLIKYVKQNT